MIDGMTRSAISLDMDAAERVRAMTGKGKYRILRVSQAHLPMYLAKSLHLSVEMQLKVITQVPHDTPA